MKKIAIIGLGLIGTSLLKALKNKGLELYGISRSHETVQKALDYELIKKGSCDYDILKGIDLILIATPINNVIETIDKIKEVEPKATIADLASVKGFIMDYVNNLEEKLDFIGLHPMAGTENKGFDAAQEDLFIESKWAVIPSESAKSESIEKVCELIKSINAKPIMTDAKTHDRAVAMISHMPMVLSQALFKSIEDESALTFKLAASGFRDCTRLAGSNIEMAKDMMQFNGQNIKEVAQKLKIVLDEFLMNYDAQDIESIAAKRKKMYSEDGKNIY